MHYFSKERFARLVVLISFSFISAFMVGTGFAQTQTGTIVGTVVEEGTLTPLLSVNVVVAGTRLGASTDRNGEFRIERVPAGTHNLEISYIGYSTQERDVTVLANREVTVDAELELDPLQMDEILVVGYGTIRKEALTGAMVAISAEKLRQIPTTTFQDVIQGTPGVLVSSNDGAPGAGISIRIRGIGSISAGSEPLYVIDGVPLLNSEIGRTSFNNGGRTANPLASINPNDIESLVVLKDAASTAIYGSRGANGVILITTKGGVSGNAIFTAAPKFNLLVQRGYSDYAHGNLLNGLTGEQYHEYFIEARVNGKGDTPAEAEAQYQSTFPLLSKGFGNTDWRELTTQAGITQQYDLSATGGGEMFTYFVSGSYFDQEGVTLNAFFERFSSRINLTAQLTEKFSIANNMSYSYTNQTAIQDGSAWEANYYMAIFMPPAVPVFNEEGQYYGAHQKKNIMGGNNPVGMLVENPKLRETARFIDNLTARYQINTNFVFQSSWSFDIYNVDDYLIWNPRYGSGRNSGGLVNEARSDNIVWQGTQTLNYNNTFKTVHNFDAVAGYEANKSSRDRVEVWGEQFAHPDLKTVNSAALISSGGSDRSVFAFESMFARVNYDYDRKYYLSGSFRTDGSSRFGPANRWGKFWSVGAGYTLTEESFLQDITFIDYLKIRSSYGKVGNAEIGNYEWQGLYSFTPDYDGAPGAQPSQIQNENLTWESMGNFNIGFDYAIMNNRFSGTVDWYKKTSSDLLLNVPTSYTTGFTSVLQNFGDMENTGLEFSVLADVINRRDYNLSLNFTIATQKNKITKLGESFLAGTKRREEGRDYQEYYLLGFAGINPDNGKVLYWTDETKSATTEKTSGAVRFYDGKSATPDFLGSFGFNGNFKKLTFNVNANYRFGSYLFEGAARFYHGDGRYAPRSTSQWAWDNRWKKPGDIAKVPQLRWGGNSNSQPNNSSRYLFNGNFIRLKNVRLGYPLPDVFTNMLKVGSVEAYINLNNYFTWVKDGDLHFDPEQVISGVYNTGTPNSKTFSFGWNISF